MESVAVAFIDFCRKALSRGEILKQNPVFQSFEKPDFFIAIIGVHSLYGIRRLADKGAVLRFYQAKLKLNIQQL